MSEQFESEGYRQALDLLRQCATPHGFVAAAIDRDNYRRIWGRDSAIMGLAALLTNDEELIAAQQSSLETLQRFQGQHGEIPSNVDVEKNTVSYGGTTGRVDANLWFIIACGAHLQHNSDSSFIEKMWPSLQKVEWLLGAWEFNNKGLIYVPQTGDWSDEYLQEGYILYDQLLYYLALTYLQKIESALHNQQNNERQEKINKLKKLIQVNYWFIDCALDEPDAYHPVLHKKGCEAAEHRNEHWMAFFSPAGYGYRFDALANVFASLFGIADDEQRVLVDRYIEQHVTHDSCQLLPAFHPVIQPEDDAWNELQMSFSFSFKNKPYEFHNGGLWPFVTGFYVVDLAKRGQLDRAECYLAAIDKANRLDENDGEWGFYEYHHGKKFTPGGTRLQGWSAGASIMGHHALTGQYPFQV